MRASQICGAASLVLMSLSAVAAQISYQFQATATDGPLASNVAIGVFSYDSSIAVPNGTLNASGLLTFLNFTWDGISYDEISANTGFMQFGSAGQLTEVTFGSNCTPGNCSTNLGEEAWFIGAVAFPSTGQFFEYCIAGGLCGSGVVTFAPVQLSVGIPVVSQPTSIFLLWAMVSGSMIFFRSHFRAPSG